ncbi:toll-like receptor 13 [Anabrus simplex]|uniref:toll-like receptor 13 n=1 Tax=Anabrus simplex TaxID=316456 RepID=UPI0035A384D4
MLCFKKCRWCSWLMISVILIFLAVDLTPEAATIVLREENISSLDLRHMSIRTVHERQFSSYSLTRSLDLSNNLIYSIHKDGFCGMNSLFMLDLSDNELQYIHPETFKCCPVLKRLYLKNNQVLDSGTHHVFLYSKSIKIVDISYCNFKKFSNEMFSGMTSLKEVIAIGNVACRETKTQTSIDQIYCGLHTPDHHSKLNDTISDQTTDGLEETIIKNEVIPTTTTTTKVIPTKLKNLESDLHESVTLSGTLNVAGDETDKFVSNYEHPDDCANNSEGRPCGDHSMDRIKLSSEEHIKTTAVPNWKERGKEEIKKGEYYKIKIREMKIIPESYFVGMESTSVLNLSHLNIVHIDVRAFCGLDSLVSLILSGNNLHYLHPSTFHCTPRLQNLYLSDNPNLTLYKENAFISSPSLRYLDISNCHFLSFQKDVYSDLPQLTYINAVGNAGCPQIIRYFRGVSHPPCTNVIHSEQNCWKYVIALVCGLCGLVLIILPWCRNSHISNDNGTKANVNYENLLPHNEN